MSRQCATVARRVGWCPFHFLCISAGTILDRRSWSRHISWLDQRTMAALRKEKKPVVPA
jgi:hypothetical protein